MFVFVFEDVLEDYTPGMAVVVAPNLERAQELMWARCWGFDDVAKFLEKNSGFKNPTGQYPTTSTEEGTHVCYGGS